jgi:hypothetical protein
LGRKLAPAIASGASVDSLRAKAEADRVLSAAGLSRRDISEAAFIVLSMSTKDMDDDIRLIIGEMRAVNAAKLKTQDLIKKVNQRISQEMSKHPGSKDATREQAGKRATRVRQTSISPVLRLEYAKAPSIPTLPQEGKGVTIQSLKSLLDDLKGKLDGMNEMSEMTSLRLQMTMDRRSKFIATLSNIMKKTSSTQDTLVQNLK